MPIALTHKFCNEDRANHFGMTRSDGALPAGAKTTASELILFAHCLHGADRPRCLRRSCLEAAEDINSKIACARSVVGPAVGAAATVRMCADTRNA